MQDKSSSQNKHQTPWLLAFMLPFAVAALFGGWLGYSEFAENVGKNYSVFGQVPGPFDVWIATVEMLLILGLPAGFLGLGVFAIYRFLRRGSA